SKKRAAKPKAIFPANLPPAAAGLVDTLKLWRGQTAREQGVPAYVILHDKTLHELAARRPQNMEALLNVGGIGEAKAIRYGVALLELLKA
ncbi:MAG: HRDC domain-containing protein, partial [Sterolibacterium sp.]